MIRTASMPKEGSYSAIRSFLNVYHPVFHAVTQQQMARAFRAGIRASGPYFELRGHAGERGIPLSRNLDLLMTNPYSRPYILVLDQDQMSTRYRVEETEVPDDVGGYVLIVRGSIIPPMLIRGLIVGDRIYNMRSQKFTKQRPGLGPSPAVRAPSVGVL